MPDWTIHVGGAYILGRPWWKENLRFFLLGAILPDIFARIEAVLNDLFHADVFSHYSMESFHTPLMIFFVCILIALFTSQPKISCGLLFGGSMLHFFMDMLEKKVAGFGTPMLFPFSYTPFQIGLVHLYGPWLYLGWIFSLFILLYAVWEGKQQDIILQPAAKKTLWAFLLLSMILIVPYFTHTLFEEHNVGFSQFYKNPSAFEGKTVGIHSAEVINENPMIIHEQFKDFTLVTDQHFKKGTWVSLEGVYRDGRIYPGYIQKEQGIVSKSLLSLPALLLFPFLWWDWRKLRKVFDLGYLKGRISQFFGSVEIQRPEQ
ncbi:MAG: metal-dependent hydrolase [Candidatus Schekmanbacteria bacterium]|nr:metal-dependent hydrolase [Candidatus Schekmanbacteria bacterium]